jgi:hypothetical protein
MRERKLTCQEHQVYQAGCETCKSKSRTYQAQRRQNPRVRDQQSSKNRQGSWKAAKDNNSFIPCRNDLNCPVCK